MGLEIVVEAVTMLLHMLGAILLGMIRTVIPPRRKDVSREVCLITGAGSGIGRGMALEFADLGASMVLWDINEKGNKETAELIKKKGGTAFAYTVDVTNREKIAEVAEKVRSDVGDPTMLINNAGIVTGQKLLDIPDTMITKTMEVNLMAHFWTVRAFLPKMKENNHGHIVTIASIAGIIGCNNLVDYCASKFGNVGFHESLHYEIMAEKKYGVKTTMVCPYYIDTGMFAGCKTRFPLVLNHLQPQEAVDRIVQAVLTNQKILYIPRTMYLMAFLKSLLPVDASLVLHKFMGASNFMDEFVGRKTK